LPFGPITAASFAYDAGRAHLEHRDYSEGEWAEYSPLQGDLSDIQFCECPRREDVKIARVLAASIAADLRALLRSVAQMTMS
jgi:hypothetical protein